MKKLIAMLLAVMLCIAAFPLSSLAEIPQEKFITYIAISKDNRSRDATNALIKEGYYPLRSAEISSSQVAQGSTTDLNDGAGGDYIYMGVKKGDDYAHAIKGIIFLEFKTDLSDPRQPTDPPDSLSYGGVTFYLVGGQYEIDYVSGEPVDLNDGAGGEAIYTYITRDNHYDGGRPITNMAIFPQDHDDCFISPFSKDVLFVAGNTDGVEHQDLNAGTDKHEKYIFMYYRKGWHEHTYTSLNPAQREIHTQQELIPSVAAHYRCEVCQKYFDENKQETTLAKLTGEMPQHTYGHWESINSVYHKGQCTVCVLPTGTLTHVYDDDNDAECNDCGYMRQLCDHTFSDEWSYNEDRHWHDTTCGHNVMSGWAKHYGGTATCTEQAICAACKQPYGDLAEHTYGDLIPAQSEVHTTTELKAAVAAHYQCSACHKYLTEDKVETTLQALTSAAPQHSYGSWVNTDPDKHWKECSCGLRSEEAEHVYDNVLDEDCNVCGYVREITHVHTYAEKWSYNEYKHWHDATCEHTTLMTGWGSHVFTDLIPAQSAVHTATELKPSVAAHYQCSVCLAYFDGNKNPTTLEALTGTMPQHSYSDDQDTTCDTCGHVRTVDQDDQSTCTITFNANGGTGTMNPQTVTSGIEQTLNENQFTFDGYDFDEWNTAEDGSGNAYDDGAGITASSNITLYAQWKKLRTVNNIKNTRQPTDQSITEGQRAQFSIEATGNGLSYQWWINRNDGRGWRKADGATSNVYVTSVTETENTGYKYCCVVIARNKRVLSDVTELYVSKIPTVPQTGDSSTPMLWLALCILSLTCVLLLRKKSYGK